MKLQMMATPRSRAAWIAAFVSAIPLVWVGGIYAQSKAAPYALFEYATLVGSGNTFTASRIPIVVAEGNMVFKDITMRFDVGPDGSLTLMPDNPQITDAPSLQVSSFKAGSYVGPGSVLDGKTPAYVDGPGATDGGATSWSFSTAGGADACTYPGSATWYVGPIGNGPMAARLKKAGITSTGWSYGVASGPSYYTNCTKSGFILASNRWLPGTLVGVSQSGNAITIASFTDNGSDSSAPVAQITYRLVP